MKKILMSIVALAAFALSVNAQDAQSPDEKAQTVVERIAETGDINEGEVDLFMSIMSEYYANLYNAVADGEDEETVREIEAERDIKIKDEFGDERAEILLHHLADY